MNRTETLDAALHAVTGRDDLHGTPEQSFEAIALMWGAVLRAPVEAHEVALCMAALKIVRASNNPDHDDNWTDLAGYAACGAECAHIEQGSRCVSETGSDGKTVAENTNTHTDPFKSGCDDEGWIDHDGSDRCPVSDGNIRVEVTGPVDEDTPHINTTSASNVRWTAVKRWRIAEVDGWVRWSGRNGPKLQLFDKCEVVYRDGKVSGPHFAGNVIWRQDGDSGDIIAYREAR